MRTQLPSLKRGQTPNFQPNSDKALKGTQSTYCNQVKSLTTGPSFLDPPADSWGKTYRSLYVAVSNLIDVIWTSKNNDDRKPPYSRSHGTDHFGNISNRPLIFGWLLGYNVQFPVHVYFWATVSRRSTTAEQLFLFCDWPTNLTPQCQGEPAQVKYLGQRLFSSKLVTGHIGYTQDRYLWSPGPLLAVGKMPQLL